MNYNVDYFISKFEAIPESQWLCEDLTDKGRKCAAGHCGVKNGDFIHNCGGYTIMNSFPKEALALADLLKPVSDHINQYDIIWNLNDGNDGRYPQPTPRQRILAALYDIKKMQQPKYPDQRTAIALLSEQPVTEVDVIQEPVKIEI